MKVEGEKDRSEEILVSGLCVQKEWRAQSTHKG